MAGLASRRTGRGRDVTGMRDPLVAYLGWHGKSNLGDEAVYDAKAKGRNQVVAKAA